jgi:hypothetical protein
MSLCYVIESERVFLFHVTDVSLHAARRNNGYGAHPRRLCVCNIIHNSVNP